MANDVVFRRINGRVVPIRRSKSRSYSGAKAAAGATLIAANHPGKRTLGKSGKYNINRVKGFGGSVRYEARKPFRPFASSFLNVVHGKKKSTINMASNRRTDFRGKKNFHKIMSEATADLGARGRKRFSFNVVSPEGLSISKMGKTRFSFVDSRKNKQRFINRAEVNDFLRRKYGPTGRGSANFRGQWTVGTTRIPDKNLSRGSIRGKWGKGRAALFLGGAALIGSSIYDWSRNDGK